MAYTTNPQYQRDTKERQERSEFKRRSIGDVRQDNNAPGRDRMASTQAYPPENWTRTRPLGINSDRSKKRSSKRQTESVTAWVKKPIRSVIAEFARREGMTRSKKVGCFLER